MSTYDIDNDMMTNLCTYFQMQYSILYNAYTAYEWYLFSRVSEANELKIKAMNAYAYAVYAMNDMQKNIEYIGMYILLFKKWS